MWSTRPEKGPLAESLPEGTRITFSLDDWEGDRDPRFDQMVELEGVQLFRQGWRASKARPITPVANHNR